MRSRLNTNRKTYNTDDKYNVKRRHEKQDIIEEENEDEYSNDSSYYNFEVLKQINRDFLNNDSNIENYYYSKIYDTRRDEDTSTNTTSNEQEIPIIKNKTVHNKYEGKRAKELKHLISKMNNIINENYSNNTMIEEDEKDDSIFYNDSNLYDSNINQRRQKKKNDINKYRIAEKEKILKQFNKDLLNLSTALEKKKNQLNNKESKIKRREFKIKTVLSEFDRIMKEDKMWKKDLENLRNDYQSSIDILNRENKRLIESLEELSNNEENLKTELKEKDKEIEDLKKKNKTILEEKNKIQTVTNELKKEISQLKEKIKEMQDSNTVLHQNYEKLSNKKKEVTIKKNVSVTAEPETKSIEIQTKNSNILEKIINQQYMDIKKLFSLFHYVLTLYNKNNMEDNEYRQLWNDIRTKFFKNKELKEIKIYNYIPYIINYSLKKENISNIFETKPEHFVRLLLEFVMDYLNENSLAFEQKFKIVNIIIKYGTIIPNTQTSSSSPLNQNNSTMVLPSPYEHLKSYPTMLDIPVQGMKKLSLLTSMVTFNLNYDRESHVYLYLYLISLYSYQDIIETKEDFISTLSEYADTVSYILIFIFNGLINELTTSEKRILFANNYGLSILLKYLNSYNKYYIYLSSIILVELFSDNKCQSHLLKKLYNNTFFDLCCKLLNYNNINISENICIALQKLSSYSDDNSLLYNNQKLMNTLANLLNCSGYNPNSHCHGENDAVSSKANTFNTNENLGVHSDYEFMALNILSIFKKKHQK